MKNGIRVAVAGASGFVGSAIVEALAAAGNKVIALCRDGEKGRRRFARIVSDVEVVPWDMADAVACSAVDAIIHAAGNGDPASYSAKPAEAMRDALLGCINLLDFAVYKGATRFILVSSGEAYGILHAEGRIRETDYGSIDPHSSRSVYPLCKMATESLCLAYGRERGIDVSIARLCHVYGPGISPSDSRIAAVFPLAVAQGRDIVMKSVGEQTRSLCYIADAATGVAAVLAQGKPGEAYNVADEGTELTVREFAERTAMAGGVRVTFHPATKTETLAFNPMPRATFSAEKIRALGWRPQTDFSVGLEATLAYFRELCL